MHGYFVSRDHPLSEKYVLATVAKKPAFDIFFSRTLIASRSEHVFYILQAHGLSKIPCFHTRTQASQWALRKGHPMTQVAGNTAGLSWNRRYQPFPRPAAGQHNAH